MNENKNPYHGIGIITLIEVALPFAVFFIVRAGFNTFSSSTKSVILWQSVFVAGIIAVLFTLGFFIGCLGKPLMVVVNRLKDFFSYLPISKKVAFSCYALDIKENGVVFWIYLLYLFYSVAWLILGIVKFIPLYVE